MHICIYVYMYICTYVYVNIPCHCYCSFYCCDFMTTAERLTQATCSQERPRISRSPSAVWQAVRHVVASVTGATPFLSKVEHSFTKSLDPRVT